MNDEEIVKIALDKKMSKKKRDKILTELKAKGIDWTRITFKYVAEHPEKYSDYIVEMPLVNVANWMVKTQNILDGKD